MNLHLVRNATLRLNYAGQTLLIDPFLAPRHALPSFAGLEANPTVDLPSAPQAVLDGADLVLVSHLHPDHFDPLAQELMPKDLPLICQPGDVQALHEAGFQTLLPLAEARTLQGITVTPTPGQHGSGSILEQMGQVMGWVLQAAGEPTVYWAGDTILTPDVLDVIARIQPDVIVTHSGGAMLGGTLLIMDATQTLDVCRAAPNAVVVAVHLEALDHCTVSREALAAAAQEAGLAAQLRIPGNGEEVPLG